MAHDEINYPGESANHLRNDSFVEVELADTYKTVADKINALGLEVDSLDHETKAYVDSLTTPSSNLSIGTYGKNTVYENTSARKIMIVTRINGGNDIGGFNAYIGPTTGTTELVAYIEQWGDGGSTDAETFTIVVPSGWYFKFSGDANIHRSEGWEM